MSDESSSATPFTADRYHALVQAMDQGFCVLEVLFDEAGQQAVDYRYLEINPTFAQQSGMPADAVGKTIRELMPDIDPFWFDTFGQVVRTKVAVRLEHRVPQLSRWFDVHAFPIGVAAARQVAVLFTDITARKQTETALRHAAEVDTFRLQLADALGPLVDPAAVQETVTHLTRLHFGADRCYYCEIENGQAIIRQDAAAAGLPSVAGTYPLADFMLLQAVIEAGRPFSVRDVRHDDTVDDNLRQLCVQLQVISYLDVPVLKHGQPAGVLCLVQSQPRDWAAADVALAAEVAERTWVAVERARAENALRTSEKQFRTVANLVPDLLWRSTPGSETIWYNQRWYEYTGQTLEDATGYGWTDVIHPADQAESSRRYRAAVADGQPLHQEHRMRSAQGDYRWFQVQAQPLRNEAGKVIAWFGAATDIHARKQHEANLVLLDDISQQLADLTTLEATMHRLGKRIGQHFGVRQCMLAELSADQEIALATYGWHADGSPPLTGAYRLSDYLAAEQLAALRRGEVFVVTDTQADPQVSAASYRALGIHSFINVPLVRAGRAQLQLFVLDEQPRRWRDDEVALLRELSARLWTRMERARAEQALQASEHQLRVATDASQLGTWEWDIERDEVRWNDWHFWLLGLEPQPGPLTAADFIRFVHPADVALVQRRLQAALVEQVPYEAEFRVITAQGEERWMSGHGQVVQRDAQGHARRLSGVMLNITARKQAEQAEELRQRLAQQQQLFEAVQEAQEEERRRLSESLHNGIGQILYAVRLQLDRLPALPELPARHEAARLLSEAIRQTRTLSHELTPALLEEFGLEKTLQSICNTLKSPRLHWHCQLVFEEGPPLPLSLQLVVYRLAQELAQNVVKHARATEATLEVEVLPAWVVLRVEDNGHGFDLAHTSEGLGLRSLRSRVALLNGSVHLTTAPGQGTHCQIRIPLSPFA